MLGFVEVICLAEAGVMFLADFADRAELLVSNTLRRRAGIFIVFTANCANWANPSGAGQVCANEFYYEGQDGFTQE